jgi:hypothetical protein
VLPFPSEQVHEQEKLGIAPVFSKDEGKALPPALLGSP